MAKIVTASASLPEYYNFLALRSVKSFLNNRITQIAIKIEQESAQSGVNSNYGREKCQVGGIGISG
jgi:hypothetical protein